MAFLWWRRRAATPRQRPDLRVTMFTRANCPLCDEAWALLERYRGRYGFALEVKDVDASQEWVRDYGMCVPVVLINDKVRFRGRINEVLLRRLLDASAPKA